MFSEAQMQALQDPLDRKHVRQREQSGRKLSYVEGWHVIAEANRIFGFDGWSSETVETKCVAEREREIGQGKAPGFGVTYVAKVRVTLRSDGETIIREGCGTGHGIDRDLGQAHESAIKEAETDARKRALMTFGNQFGLALYDKEQTNVCDEGGLQARRDGEAFVRSNLILIANFKTVKEMTDWWNSDDQKKARRDFALSPEQLETLKNKLVAQKAAIEKKEAA